MSSPRLRLPDLIEGVLPQQQVSLLAGASGAGKTTVIMQLLADMQRNQPVFTQFKALPNLKIGYIAADRTWADYESTAEKVGLDLDRMSVVALIDDDSIKFTEFEEKPMDTLFALIGRLGKVDLVVVDPLVVFLGVDTNKYHLNASRLMRLNKWCRASQLTILGTHHATKARSDYSFKRPQDRISGSGALLGFTSTQLFLASPEETGDEQGRTQWTIVSHQSPARTLYLQRGEGGMFEYVGEDMTAALTTRDRVMLLLSDASPTPREALVREMGPFASPRTVDNILKELMAMDLIYQPSYGHYALAPVRGA